MNLNYQEIFDFIINLTLKTEFLAISILVISVIQYFFIYKTKRFSEISLDVMTYLVLMFIAGVSANKFEVVNQIYKFRMFDFGINFYSVLVAFILCDFIFYFFHWIEHKFPFLWSLHQVHHSSLDISYATSLRIPWLLFFVTPFYYAPLIFFGFHPLIIIFCKKMILTYQFLIHKPVRKKDSILGKYFITYQAHSAHHLADPKFHNKNFGGILSIWDHMFGTYVECDESVAPEYGVRGAPVYRDPFSLNFLPLFGWIKSKLTSKEVN